MAFKCKSLLQNTYVSKFRSINLDITVPVCNAMMSENPGHIVFCKVYGILRLNLKKSSAVMHASAVTRHIITEIMYYFMTTRHTFETIN
jgi:hypothetical protein